MNTIDTLADQITTTLESIQGVYAETAHIRIFDGAQIFGWTGHLALADRHANGEYTLTAQDTDYRDLADTEISEGDNILVVLTALIADAASAQLSYLRDLSERITRRATEDVQE